MFVASSLHLFSKCSVTYILLLLFGTYFLRVYAKSLKDASGDEEAKIFYLCWLVKRVTQCIYGIATALHLLNAVFSLRYKLSLHYVYFATMLSLYLNDDPSK